MNFPAYKNPEGLAQTFNLGGYTWEKISPDLLIRAIVEKVKNAPNRPDILVIPANAAGLIDPVLANFIKKETGVKEIQTVDILRADQFGLATTAS